MTHGWPGSVVELLETVGPLTDPTAHGGRAEDAFDLVLPSMPGYGFSGEPTELGWGPGRIATAWAELMQRLGYTRYVAQGGDVGATVTDVMGRLGTRRAASASTPTCSATGAGRRRGAHAASTPTQRSRPRSSAARHASARPASATSWSRRRGRRRSATPCSIHPSPWRPGCSTTTPTATRRSRAPSSTASPRAVSPATHRDNITLYWLTGTGASAARSYWEEAQAKRGCRSDAPRPSSVPAGFTHVPRGDLADAAELGRAGPTRTSSTSTRSTRAATSPPGKSRNSSPKRCAPPSGRCAIGLGGDASHVERHTRTDGNGAATLSEPSSAPGLIRSIAHRLAGDRLALPVEGRLASFDGATGWLNSDPLTPEGLRGRVVLVDFWTYTCVNWLRTLPYVRAWAAKYRDEGLTVVGVHTPEFGFEGNSRQRRRAVAGPRRRVPDRDRQRLRRCGAPSRTTSGRRSTSPTRKAGSGSITSARASTPMTEMVIQQLLLDAGAKRHRPGPGDGRAARPGSGGRLADAAIAGDVRRVRPEHRLRIGRRRGASTRPTSTAPPRGCPSTSGTCRGTGRSPGTPRS